MSDNEQPTPPQIPLPPTAAIPPVEPAPIAGQPPVAPPSAAAPATPPVAYPPAAGYPAAPGYTQPAASYPSAPAYGQPGSAPGCPQSGYAPGYATLPPTRAQGLAIGSMITGIASVVLAFAFFGFLPGVAAVVLGHLAQRRQPWAKSLWLTGIITGYVGVFIGLIEGFVLVGAFIYGLNDASGYNNY